MKVVVDTNVVVAGLLSPHGPPGEIVRMIASGSLSLCFDARVLPEYADVLARPKFGFDPHQVKLVLEQVRGEGHVVASDPLPDKLHDPDDQAFLEVALAGGARCLITGNVKHFPLSKCCGVKVLSPSLFLEFYRQETKREQEAG